MGQVLSNVMGNAIQYSDVSSPVTVTVSGKDPGKVIVTVHTSALQFLQKAKR
jgi:signal transduction histidine kinase